MTGLSHNTRVRVSAALLVSELHERVKKLSHTRKMLLVSDQGETRRKKGIARYQKGQIQIFSALVVVFKM